MSFVYWVLLLPLISGLLLILAHGKLSSRLSSVLSVCGLASACLVLILATLDFTQQLNFQAGSYMHQTLWSWLAPLEPAANASTQIGLRLDALSSSLSLAVLVSALCISVFLSWYVTLDRDFIAIDGEPAALSSALLFGFGHLLVTSVLLLVLADNLLLLLTGWVAMTISSYLLMSFFQQHNPLTVDTMDTDVADTASSEMTADIAPAQSMTEETRKAERSKEETAKAEIIKIEATQTKAAETQATQIQAFQITTETVVKDTTHKNAVTALPVCSRYLWLLVVADALLLVVVLGLYQYSGTFDISQIVAALQPAVLESTGLPLLVTLSLLWLCALCVKDALFPMQSWFNQQHRTPLPSIIWVACIALAVPIVYVMTRFYAVFALAFDSMPVLQTLMSVVGGLTAVFYALSAVMQYELRRVLSDITLSQMGLLCLTLSVSGWQAAVFHAVSLVEVLTLLWLVSLAVFMVNTVSQPASSASAQFDIRTFQYAGRRIKTLYLSFCMACAGLLAVPWLSGQFVSQHALVWELWTQQHYVSYAAVLLTVCVLAVGCCRLLRFMFHSASQSVKPANQLTSQSETQVNSEQDNNTSLIAQAEPDHSQQRVPAAEQTLPTGVRLYLPIIILLLLSTPMSYLLLPELTQILPLSEGQLLRIQSSDSMTFFAVTYMSLLAVILGLGVGVFHYVFRRQGMTDTVMDSAVRQTSVLPTAWLAGFAARNFGMDFVYDVISAAYDKFTHVLKADPLRSIPWLLETLAQGWQILVAGFERGITRKLSHTQLMLVMTVMAIFVFILRLV